MIMNNQTAIDYSQKYVIFNLGRDCFALTVQSIQEILLYRELTNVSKPPNFVEGILNNRDQAIPVLDLKKRFGIQSNLDQPRRIIILNIQNLTLGIIVDDIFEVMNIKHSQQEQIPSDLIMNREWYPEDYFIKRGETLVLVLAPERILSPQEIKNLQSFIETQE